VRIVNTLHERWIAVYTLFSVSILGF